MRLPNASDYLRRSRDSQHNVPLTWLPSPMSTRPCVYQNRWNQSLSNCKKNKNNFPFGTFPLASSARIMIHHQIVVFTMQRIGPNDDINRTYQIVIFIPCSNFERGSERWELRRWAEWSENAASGRGQWGSRAKSERWAVLDVCRQSFWEKDLGGVAVR